MKKLIAMLLCLMMIVPAFCVANAEMPTVVMAFPTWTGRPAGADRIQERLSAITEEKLGVKLELEILDYGSWNQSMTLMLNSGEQVDIFNTLGLGYSTCVSKGYALELDELLAEYGQGILETMNPAYIEACRVDGYIFGLPQQRDIAQGKGAYVVITKYLDEIGYDWQNKLDADGESIYVDIEEIKDIFAKLHEKEPNMFVLCPNKGTQLNNTVFFDDIGNDVFGVLMDPANSLTVSNLFESEEFLAACKMFYEWNQAGYISKDVLTDSNTPQQNMKAGLGMSTLAAYKPGTKMEQVAQLGADMNVVVFKTMGVFTKSAAVTSMNWAINANTELAEEAMKVLNLLYTDAEAATLLAWGEEGVDYKKTEEGFLTYADGIDATNQQYSILNWLMPNQFITGVWEGNAIDIYEQTEKFNDDSIKSIAMGFTFDNSAVINEYTALTNVYNQYINQIILGFVEPEAGIAEMNQKLYSAGLQRYMDAKQAALNEWAAEKGIQ
ncbi:MAG: ABC transporter substrate-binding protein [Clostridia bacterium]|nr:ABC transporter substrate-binding protein [Clostridia bacterium]